MKDNPAQLSNVLLEAARPAFRAIIEHAFMRELAAGTLSVERFSYYLLQDFHYLQAAGQALALASSKALNDEWILAFNHCSTEVLKLERTLHEQFLNALSIKQKEVDGVELSPTNEAYINYLFREATFESFPVAFAALLPSFVLYADLGKQLLRHPLTNPLYRQWAEFYGGEAYEEMIDGVLELVDEVGMGVDASTRTQMLEHFVHACRYEWMFWDMAYRQERWPTL